MTSDKEKLDRAWIRVDEQSADIRLLIGTIKDLLEAFDADGECDCGGNSMCVVCNAQNIMAEMEDKHTNPRMWNSDVMEK